MAHGFEVRGGLRIVLWGVEFKADRAQSDAYGQSILVGGDRSSFLWSMPQQTCDTLLDELLFSLQRPQQRGFLFGEGVGLLESFAIEDQSIALAQIKFKSKPLQVIGLAEVDAPSVCFAAEGVVVGKRLTGHHELKALIGRVWHMQNQFLGHLHGCHGGNDQSAVAGSAVADRLEVFIEAKKRVAVSTNQSSGPGEFQIEFLAVF